jgi:short-subunit dehydrogenase
MRTLRDRVAVVTGAASGIGRALSIELAGEGCDLALCDIDEEGLSETGAQARALGRKVSLHRVDVADRERMQRFASEVIESHGRVNLVVNNAGVGVASSFEQHTLEDWEWIIGINLWGVIYGCRFFLPHLRQAKDAHIVNVSSLFGLVPVPMMTSYSATKAAIGAMSESLWMELHQEGIDVTVVYPGGVVTNVARSSRAFDPVFKALSVEVIDQYSITPQQCAKRIVKGIKKNELRVVVTPVAHTMETFKRLSPNLSQRMVERGLRFWHGRRLAKLRQTVGS